jgi:methyltransferase
MTMGFLLGATVFIPMLVEAARAARNERVQRGRGGIEPRGDVYRIMRVAYPVAFLAMIVEGVFRGGPPPVTMAAGVGLFAVAKALKWWAILSLGPAWTFRVIVVPGMPLVEAGPYRVMRHPNYVAVACEFLGVAIMTGAVITGPVSTLAFGALILRRVEIERRALDAILRRN